MFRRSFTFRVAIPVLLAGWLGTPPRVAGQLKPDQCVLIFNGRSEASGALAHEYAAARGVPEDQLLAIDAPIRESITRAEYERLALDIRGFLSGELMASRDMACLVTFFDVPLRVGAVESSSKGEQEAKVLAGRRTMIESDWKACLDSATAALPVEVQTRMARDVTGQPDDLSRRTNAILLRWWEHGRGLPADQQSIERQRLTKWIGEVQGLQGTLAASEGATASPALDDARRRTRQRLSEAEQRLQAGLNAQADDADVDGLIQAALLARGFAGAVKFLTERIDVLAPLDSEAAFDSELALVREEHVPRARWVLNPSYALSRAPPAARPPLMVSRIDGPSIEVARRLFVDAMEVEKSGLTGTVYIDARGIRDDSPYREYDDDLRMLAQWTRTRTKLPVVLDNQPEVFGPATCPDAALYCGWYSVSKYTPSMKFKPGAVAFHIASFELVSLRRDDKAYWCAGLLKDGAAATLGPTAEPYLPTFPRPTAFFVLLMSGELTLVECFARTNPCLSWRIALVGDPLYRPFACNPQYSVKEAIASLQANKEGAP